MSKKEEDDLLYGIPRKEITFQNVTMLSIDERLDVEGLSRLNGVSFEHDDETADKLFALLYAYELWNQRRW